MATATISARGWLVIPVELRKKYDLKKGTRVTLVDYGGVLAIVPAMSDPIQQSQGMLKGKSLLRALEQERKQEREREN